ncbi:hypothetical protein GBF38_005164 [Nibea albiflora]|uniref:Uncharacterized protein n=1 Tax=Nibea albiflora TaxID=240163 RepID=A0ACB7EVF1_NIBAL|nr:hypothetical protein GBF38_005164 [Nibea albiflora]
METRERREEQHWTSGRREETEMSGKWRDGEGGGKEQTRRGEDEEGWMMEERKRRRKKRGGGGGGGGEESELLAPQAVETGRPASSSSCCFAQRMKSQCEGASSYLDTWGRREQVDHLQEDIQGWTGEGRMLKDGQTVKYQQEH